MNASKFFLAAPFVALAVSSAADAHIAFAEPSAKAGSYYAGFLRVSHGCAGSATVAIRVVIPAGVMVARPQPKPGWRLAIEKQPLAAPIRGESGEVRDRVTAISWTGRLEADQFDQFGLMLKLPEAPRALYFPTTQRCEIGRNEWVAIPVAGQSWHSLKSPAPVLNLASEKGAAMDHMRM